VSKSKKETLAERLKKVSLASKENLDRLGQSLRETNEYEVSASILKSRLIAKRLFSEEIKDKLLKFIETTINSYQGYVDNWYLKITDRYFRCYAYMRNDIYYRGDKETHGISIKLEELEKLSTITALKQEILNFLDSSGLKGYYYDRQMSKVVEINLKWHPVRNNWYEVINDKAKHLQYILHSLGLENNPVFLKKEEIEAKTKQTATDLITDLIKAIETAADRGASKVRYTYSRLNNSIIFTALGTPYIDQTRRDNIIRVISLDFITWYSIEYRIQEIAYTIMQEWCKYLTKKDVGFTILFPDTPNISYDIRLFTRTDAIKNSKKYETV